MPDSTFAFVPSHHTLFAVKGLKAREFLQGQTSNDLRQLKIGKSCLALRLDLKGRVVANLRIWALGEELFIVRCHQTMVQTLLKSLSKFAVFSCVEVKEIEQSFSLVYYVGPIKHLEQQLIKGNLIKETEISKESYWPALVNSKQERYEILIKKHLFIISDKQELAKWQSLDWQDRIVDVDSNKSGLFLAHYINMVEGYLSFNKGCFLGQEIVARMQHLGQIKYELIKATYDGQNDSESKFNIGHSIIDDKKFKVGIIIEVIIANPSLTLILLQSIIGINKGQKISVDNDIKLQLLT